MHERNIFKNSRPDFDSLAQEYPEFKKYLQVGKSGKSYLCFKDPASLRALSYALLKKYFQISLDIPLDRLIPTIPLRLNYVHWVEDLIGLNKVNVSGIDIGCGASCIYGLLGYRLNQWKIFATELDKTSYEYANKNVHNNDATQYIKVWKVGSDQNYFMPIMNSSTVEQFEFSMCNPPFFDEMADNEEKNRTSRRPPPACASTASDLESFTSGGEVNFIEKMIEESCNIQKRIRWFTTMLGKKSSLKTLKKILKEKKIFHTFTTFQQGKTLRWGLAWSFTETSLQFDPSKKEKKAKAFEVCVEKDYLHKYSLDGKDHCTVLYNIIKHVENEFTRLQLEIQEQIEHITIANHDSFEMIACAFKNTWVHQRRKRREEKRLKNAQDSKNTASCIHSESTNSKNCEDTYNQIIPLKRGHDKTSLNPDCKKIKLEEIERKEDSREAIFHLSCSVSTRKEECDDVRYFVSFLCSEGDKDQCHQLCLYMNNFLKLQAT